MSITITDLVVLKSEINKIFSQCKTGCRHNYGCKNLGIICFSICYYCHGDYSNSPPPMHKNALIEMEHKPTSFEISHWSWVNQNDHVLEYQVYSYHCILLMFHFCMLYINKKCHFLKLLFKLLFSSPLHLLMLEPLTRWCDFC